MRRLVLARDGYVCRMQLPGCTGRADTVDHVVPLVLDPTQNPYDPAGLRAACTSCNSSAGAQLRGQLGRLGKRSRSW